MRMPKHKKYDDIHPAVWNRPRGRWCLIGKCIVCNRLCHDVYNENVIPGKNGSRGLYGSDDCDWTRTLDGNAICNECHAKNETLCIFKSDNKSDINRLWEFHCDLAELRKRPFSRLEVTSIEARTCKICGYENHTTDNGDIPETCSSNKCYVIRNFFGIEGGLSYASLSIKDQSNDVLIKRKRFLHTRLRNVFGHARIDDTYKSILHVVLLSAFIERMAYENERRTFN